MNRICVEARLLAQGAVLIYYSDAAPTHPHYRALQYFGLRGLIPGWEARLDEPATEAAAADWIAASGGGTPSGFRPGFTTRGELLGILRAQIPQGAAVSPRGTPRARRVRGM